MECQIIFVVLFLTIIDIGHCINDENVNDMDVGRRIEPNWVWNPSDYPNPKTDFTKCHQSKPSTICDPENLLSTAQSSKLNELVQRLSMSSPCLCKEDCAENAHNKGLVVGVALMKNFYHAMHEDKNDVVKRMSKGIMEKWNLGTCGNDIIILIADENSVVNFEIGDAVKEFIPEETIGDIFDQCKDYFELKDYYQGLESIINSLYDSIQAKLLKAPEGNEEDTNTGNIGLTVGIVVGIACLAAFAVVVFLIMRRRRRANNQNGFMYDGQSGGQGIRHIKRDMIGPIVKNPVVFPDAVYQPCSIDDGKKAVNTQRREGSDDEDDVDNNEDNYLRKLEENPAYDHEPYKNPRQLSTVEERTEQESTAHPVLVVDPQNEVNLPLNQNIRENAGYA